MMKITLEIANNGVIKTVTDSNINGAGDSFEEKTVYDFKNDFSHQKKIEFFYEIADDLGIETGNAFNKNSLIMTSGWGASYQPSTYDVKQRKLRLESEIKLLETYESDVKKDQT